MATNAQHSSVWINIQRAQQSMHALEFFISTSQAILSRKGLCDWLALPLCATQSQPASNSLCTIVPSLHTLPLVRINRRELRVGGFIHILFSTLSLSVLIIDPPIQEYFCCERSCGKLIFSQSVCVCVCICSKTTARTRQASEFPVWKNSLRESRRLLV